MKHSPVGGSGMHRWVSSACPGSVLAESEAARDEENVYSAEGVCAHELAAACTSSGLPAKFFLGHVFNKIPVDQEMVGFVQGYVNWAARFPGKQLVEWWFRFSDVHPQFYGTLDLANIDFENRIAYVADFKYGRRHVAAAENLQLLYYATALILGLGLREKIDKIYLTIYQPRLFDRESNYETWSVGVHELINWAIQVLKPSIALALSPDAPRNSGKHCLYCRAKLTCSTFLESAEATRGYSITPDNTGLAIILDSIKPLKKLGDEAEAEAVARISAGQKIPGYKPVRKMGKSKITNTVACAAELLTAGLTTGDIYKNQLKGITELKENPVARKIVPKFITRESGGIKIVPIESHLPAVAVATQTFENRGL